MDELELTTEDSGDGIRRVSIRGDLDAHGAQRVERALAGLVDGATEVVVDVTGCRFADSTALAVLFSSDLRLGQARVFPVASDRNILQILRWRVSTEAAARHG